MNKLFKYFVFLAFYVYFLFCISFTIAIHRYKDTQLIVCGMFLFIFGIYVNKGKKKK